MRLWFLPFNADVEVWRRECNSNCSQCTTEIGCFNAETDYNDVDVTCSVPNDLASDAETLSFTIDIEAAAEPEVSFPGHCFQRYIYCILKRHCTLQRGIYMLS